MPGTPGTIRLFQFAGINVFLHWSWFLVAAYEIEDRGRYSSLAWSGFEYLALFAIVLAHEFGHALACRQVGGTADRVVLWPLGGVAYVSPPPRPGATLWSIAAGPLVNVALIPILGVLYFAFSASQPSQSDFMVFLGDLSLINFGLLLFNILPIYPLDGGKILRSLLWFVLGRAQSLMVVVMIGFIGVAGLVAVAIAIRSILLVILALFAAMQCFSGYREAKALKRLAEIPRHEGIACPTCKVSPPRGAFWACPMCRVAFDTFDTSATCPSCNVTFPTTMCPTCRKASPYAEWLGTGLVTHA
jgi:Zn-dependent protease